MRKRKEKQTLIKEIKNWIYIPTFLMIMGI